MKLDNIQIFITYIFLLAIIVESKQTKIKPQIRTPLRIRNYHHKIIKEANEIYQKYGYSHVKKHNNNHNNNNKILPEHDGDGNSNNNYDKVKKYLSEHHISPHINKHDVWKPPLPPVKERSGVWASIAPEDKTHYHIMQEHHHISHRRKKMHDRLDHQIARQLKAHCKTGPTITYRTYHRDISENFRYLIGAIIYTLNMNSSLVLRPPILDYPGVQMKNKTNEILEFGCFPPQVKHKGGAHRLFLLAATMQGCMEPILACSNPAWIPSLYTSIKSHHFNTRNTVIDWNVWEEKSSPFGIYSEIMEMSVNDYLDIPSIHYKGSRWVLVRNIAKRIWRLSPHMKGLARQEKESLKRTNDIRIGVHLTPLRSSPSKLAGSGSPPGFFSSGSATKSNNNKESPFAIYLMAMERVYKKIQDLNKKDKNVVKHAFIYATNKDEIKTFKKQAKEKGWEIVTVSDRCRNDDDILYIKTTCEVIAIDIMSEMDYFIGAASSGLSWTVQAVRKQSLSTGISLDDPWSQRI